MTVVIPTLGRAGLARAFDSIDRQRLADAAEVLVIGDTHSGPLPEVEALVRARGPRYRYVEHDGGKHLVGHPQRNFGMTGARGEWLAWMADDDIYTPGAFTKIAAAIAAQGRPRPLLFRVQLMHLGGLTVWSYPEIRQANIDAECVVAPNVPAKLGRWGDRYEGDYDFIAETAELWGEVAWSTALVAIGRPTEAQNWTRRPAAEVVA